MNNYHTLMAIVAALNNAAVQRLKQTKGAISTKTLQVWKDFEKVMHPQGSFKEYRAALHKSKPPALPYLYVAPHI